MLDEQEDTMISSFLCHKEVEICKPLGSIDSTNCNGLYHQVMAIIQTEPAILVVDLENISFMDGCGLGLLIKLRNSIQSFKGKLVLANISTQVRMLLEVSKCDELFETFDSILLVKAQ